MEPRSNAMRIGRGRIPALDLRAFGPYLLVELLLPGGTLLALLLWLSQRLQAGGIGVHGGALRQSLHRAAIAAKPHARGEPAPIAALFTPESASCAR